MADEVAYDVSVVIHAADAVNVLAGCVKSALEQGDVKVQVVIVDDASTDDTASLCVRIAGAHKNVNVVSRVEADSRTLAWLDGVTASKGTYAVLLEASDRLLVGGLRKLLDIAKEYEADVVDDMRETFRGQLVETRLFRRALAEFGDAKLGPGEDPGILFMVQCLASRPVSMANLTASDLRLPKDPEVYTPADIEKRCRMREVLAPIADYLDRSEGWDDHRAAWDEFTLGLAARAIEPFPRAVEPKDWEKAASILLDYWGGPYVAAVLSGAEPDEQTVSALALGASRRLRPSSAKVKRALLCVSAGADLELVERVHESLAGRLEEIVVLADELVVLPDDVYQLVSLPLGRGALPRCLALDTAITQQEPDAVVFVGARPHTTVWDALTALAKGLPVGLVTDWDAATDEEDELAYDPEVLVERMGEAALATVFVPAPDAPAGVIGLMDLRVATLEGLVSQLTLGAPRPMELADRLMLIRLSKLLANLLDRLAREEEESQSLRDAIAASQLAFSSGNSDPSMTQLFMSPLPVDRPSPYVVKERKRPPLFRRRHRRLD